MHHFGNISVRCWNNLECHLWSKTTLFPKDLYAAAILQGITVHFLSKSKVCTYWILLLKLKHLKKCIFIAGGGQYCFYVNPYFRYMQPLPVAVVQSHMITLNKYIVIPTSFSLPQNWTSSRALCSHSSSSVILVL